MCCNENFLEEAAESNTQWEITPAGRFILKAAQIIAFAVVGMFIGAGITQF